MRINRLLFEINCQNILGENILWRRDEQALYWTDIEGKCLYKCVMTQEVTDILTNEAVNESARSQRNEYIDEVLQVFDLPKRLASFAFTEDHNTILAAFEDGLASYQYTTGDIRYLSSPEKDLKHTRFNDGRCDPKGRFWVGSMVEDPSVGSLPDDEKGSLYKFENTAEKAIEVKVTESLEQAKGNEQEQILSKNQLTQMIGGISISNSLCFSADASIMYHSDSHSHKIYQYDLSNDGDILDKKLFAKFDKYSFPDGACVDTQGNVWCALWGRACVVCLNSKGKEILHHPLAITQATCVAIGGPSMNWLFVSSARIGLRVEQLTSQTRAGNVFVYELSEPLGREESIFNMSNILQRRN